MYSKKVHLKKETIDQSIKENSPISKEQIDTLRGLYSIKEYNAAVSYLFFGGSDIRMTKLTVFQANILIIHAKLLNTPVKEKRGMDITQRKNTRPYRNIWNTLEERTR